jgi:uracil-DNA glycosylase
MFGQHKIKYMKFFNVLQHELVNKIDKSLFDCEICFKKNLGVFNKRGGTFISENSNNIDVMFIAQNPGSSNIKDSVPSDIVPFGLNRDSHYHYFFDLFAHKFKLVYNRLPVIYITNIIKCVTYNNEYPTDEAIQICTKKYLYKEIVFFNQIYKDYLIVLLGATAKKIATTNLLKRKNYLQLNHPGYMNRQGKAYIEKQVDILLERLNK